MIFPPCCFNVKFLRSPGRKVGWRNGCDMWTVSILRTNKCNVDGTTVVALDGSICCKKQKQKREIVFQKRKTKSNVMGTILKILFCQLDCFVVSAGCHR